MAKPDAPVPAKMVKKDNDCWASPPDTDFDSIEFRTWCALHQGGRYYVCRKCGYWLNEDMIPRLERLSAFRDGVLFKKEAR
jgi:hypothetical protein